MMFGLFPLSLAGSLLTTSSGYSSYVPYNPDLLKRALGLLRSNLGAGINIAFWIFILLTGIYLVFNVISSIGK